MGSPRLEEQVGGLGDGKLDALAKDRREVLTGEVLHHDEGDAVDRLDVVNAGDVRALDAAGRAGFLLEARGHVGLVEQGTAEELERAELAQLPMTRGEDHAHAAFAEDVRHVVLVEDDVADLEGIQCLLPHVWPPERELVRARPRTLATPRRGRDYSDAGVLITGG
jgi:hypothetical protein